MKSIGETLKDARVKKKLSFVMLSSKTKIRVEFLQAIENEEWEKLPEFPVVLGFAKSVAGALGLSSQAVGAMLKRDYPPKELPISPKPDVSKTFIWSPRIAFVLGIIGVSLLVIGYLIFQYIGFVSPPKLVVDFPKDNQTVQGSEVFVSGKTETDAIVKANNQPVLVDSDGNFSTSINVVENTKEVVVVANSRSGKETVVRVNIRVELGK